MSKNPDEILSKEDLEWERAYFSVIAELKRENFSRYENLAIRLSAGGEEILNLPTGVYKVSVDANGCAYSYRPADSNEFQRLGWTKLSQISSERVSDITDVLAECEARAKINV